MHCAAAERRLGRARTRRVVGRAAAGVGVVVAVPLVAAWAGALQEQLRAAKSHATATAGRDSAPAADAETAPTPDVPAPTRGAQPLATPSDAAPARARLRPRVGEGRTVLGGGVVADRRGDTVVVLFDNPRTRTRKADKFETTVRATLPAVYGPAAAAALARVPRGALVGAGGLFAAAARGLHVRLDDGQTLALRPETRAGQDGPLVVRYAVTLDPAGTRP